jgi:hypothetical protein
MEIFGEEDGPTFKWALTFFRTEVEILPEKIAVADEVKVRFPKSRRHRSETALLAFSTCPLPHVTLHIHS